MREEKLSTKSILRKGKEEIETEKKNNAEDMMRLGSLFNEATTCNNESRANQIMKDIGITGLTCRVNSCTLAEQLKRMNPDEKNLLTLMQTVEKMKLNFETQKKQATALKTATVQLVIPHHQQHNIATLTATPVVQAILPVPQIPTGPPQHQQSMMSKQMPQQQQHLQQLQQQNPSAAPPSSTMLNHQTQSSGHLQHYQPSAPIQQPGARPAVMLMGQLTNQEPSKNQGARPVDPTKKMAINRPPNYKTVPCRLFHSPLGCERGEECHFIHDHNHAGRETPNMQKYVRPLSKLSKNEDQNKKLVAKYMDYTKKDPPVGGPQQPQPGEMGNPYMTYQQYPPGDNRPAIAPPPPIGGYYAPPPGYMYPWGPPPPGGYGGGQAAPKAK